MHTLLPIPTFIRITQCILLGGRRVQWIGPTSISTPLRVHSLLVVLRRANQEEHLAPTALLASRRQIHGLALGSDRHTGAIESAQAYRPWSSRPDEQAAEFRPTTSSRPAPTSTSRVGRLSCSSSRSSNLRINSFYGTSENAVKTQIWIAVSIYVSSPMEASLYQILQILSVTQFEKMPLLQALQPSDSPNSPYDPNQLILFDF